MSYGALNVISNPNVYRYLLLREDTFIQCFSAGNIPGKTKICSVRKSHDLNNYLSLYTRCIEFKVINHDISNVEKINIDGSI